MTVPPPTPPSTAPTSPTNSASSDGDCVIEVGTDPEKDGYRENQSEVAQTISSKQTGNGRLKQYLPSLSVTPKLPHIPKSWRQADGREKHVSSIDDHPRGYPQLAAFASSDDNFLMCRRFGYLHSRVLLHRQDELAELEKTLLAMDEEDAELDELALQSRRRDDGRPEEPSRKSLIAKIDTKLKDYDDLISRIRSSLTISRPAERNFASFYRWIFDEKPLCREETDFVKHEEDFIALAEKQEGVWFDGVLEDSLSILPRTFTKRILASPEQRKKSDDPYVRLYSKRRIDILARLILTIVSTALLVAPTAVLFLVHDSNIVKIMLIMVFTLLFSMALSVMTKAKRHEAFAATAAYCAVLVVFLGNFGTSGS